MAQPCGEVIPHLSGGAPESSGETAGWTGPAPNTSFRPRPEPTYSWILCELQKLRLPNKRKTKNICFQEVRGPKAGGGGRWKTNTIFLIRFLHLGMVNNVVCSNWRQLASQNLVLDFVSIQRALPENQSKRMSKETQT